MPAPGPILPARICGAGSRRCRGCAVCPVPGCRCGRGGDQGAPEDDAGGILPGSHAGGHLEESRRPPGCGSRAGEPQPGPEPGDDADPGRPDRDARPATAGGRCRLWPAPLDPARCAAEQASAEEWLAAMRQAATPLDRMIAVRVFLGMLSGLLAVAQLARPTTRRTLALLGELLEAQGRPDLHETALSLMGSAHLSRADVQALLDQCVTAFDRAVAVYQTPIPFGFALQAHVRPYHVAGNAGDDRRRPASGSPVLDQLPRHGLSRAGRMMRPTPRNPSSRPSSRPCIPCWAIPPPRSGPRVWPRPNSWPQRFIASPLRSSHAHPE